MADRKSKCDMRSKNSLIWLKAVIFYIIFMSLLVHHYQVLFRKRVLIHGRGQLRDDQQQLVTVSSEPSRIVSLAPSNTEVLFTLGLGDRIVGVTDFCNYPAEALGKTGLVDFQR